MIDFKPLQDIFVVLAIPSLILALLGVWKAIELLIWLVGW
jgi:hypothetical protein